MIWLPIIFLSLSVAITNGSKKDLNKLSGDSKTAPRVAGIVIKTERNVKIKYFVILLPFGKKGVLKERYKSKQREKFKNSTIF